MLRKNKKNPITKPCSRHLLQKLQKDIELARMEVKPGKFGSIFIVKAPLRGKKFHISDEPIPTVQDQPFKSLGGWYNADLKDTQQVEQFRQDTVDSLKRIKNTALPGKLRLWCLRFGLIPWLMWPITWHDRLLSHASRPERLVN